jgi:hypothetical protein
MISGGLRGAGDQGSLVPAFPPVRVMCHNRRLAMMSAWTSLPKRQARAAKEGS